MNARILNTEIQEFINAHLESNTATLRLKGIPFNTVDALEIIEQIEAKQRCKQKLPTWFNGRNIYFPNKLNIEQTSSEITAKYKAELISGTQLLDITGGFGVDCYYFSKHFKTIDYCDINPTLCDIAEHNFNTLNSSNIKVNTQDGLAFLEATKNKYDWIYIDPSRRNELKGKVFLLSDCLPNVPENLELLFKHSKNILIKTSPLVDISIGIGSLKHVKTIHVVAVNNEVKELLWILEHNTATEIEIHTINLKNETTSVFNFNLKNEKSIEPQYALPLKYIYEPNSAILKSGGFQSVCHYYKLAKLHKHSHLYTSNTLIDFPGRRFKVNRILTYHKKIHTELNFDKANITTRNFAETVEQLRKKLKIKDGGSHFLFFTTNMENQKIVIDAEKI